MSSAPEPVPVRPDRALPVKVCCISTPDEAALAIRWGASALGLVSEMPSGPGIIDERTIADITASVADEVSTFLLTSKTRPAEIADQVRRAGTSTVQLVERLPPGAHEALRDLLPDTTLVQVIHVGDMRSLEEAAEVAPRVDCLLLDTGDREGPVVELGGTGRTHDWSVSRAIVAEVDVPVYLAGGLGPDNVALAIETVRPFGVDLCSGVRRDGRLDEGLLARFMRAVDEAA